MNTNEVKQVLNQCSQGVDSISDANVLLAECFNVITDLLDQIPKAKTRTKPQNASLQLYARFMAKALNDAGYSFTDFTQHIKAKGIEVPWTEDIFKDEVWRRIQKPMVGHDKTSKLKTDELSNVYEVVNSRMAEIAGVSMPLPNRFDMSNM